MAERMTLRTWWALLLAVAGLLGFSAAPAAACDASNQNVFGISPGCMDLRIADAPTAANLAPDFFQAGGHPYEIAAALRLNAPEANDPVHGPYWPPEAPRDLRFSLPPGLTADLSAVPSCEMERLKSAISTCPTDSQIGVVAVTAYIFGLRTAEVPLFSIDPPAGVPARFGFSLEGNFGILDAELGPDGRLSLHGSRLSTLAPATGLVMALWGVPADPRHDPKRACPGQPAPTPDPLGSTGPSCPAGLPPSAFLRLPTSCSATATSSVQMDSWIDPGDFKSSSVTLHRSPGLLGDPAAGGAYPAPYPGLSSEHWGPPQKFTGCERVPFDPSMEVRPSSHSADTPTGLDIEATFPQRGFTDPQAVAEADLEAGSFALPPELSLNPAVANGLTACTPAEVDLASSEPARCPDSSKLGTVEMATPASSIPLVGSIYNAKTAPGQPGETALTTYLVAAAGEATVKLVSEMRVDPNDGHLTASFDQIPELPLSRLGIDFFGGERAPFVTPAVCGRYAVGGRLTPRSGTGAVAVSDTFEITSGPGGGACPNSSRDRPFNPGFGAVGSNPFAGAATSLAIRLTRRDGEQEPSSLEVSFPPGLSASLTGVAICSDAELATATGREGAAEQASPACPAAAAVGEVSATIGAGSEPVHLRGGRAYLAGPDQGAPFSLAVILPAVAGPIDMGALAVRLPLRFDPGDGHLTLAGDLPALGNGARLNLKQLTIDVNRPNFLTNPTSCRPGPVDGRIGGDAGATASVSSPFQTLGCESLGFKPRMRTKVLGGRAATKHGRHPGMRSLLSTRRGDANLRQATISLPRSAQLDPTHLQGICTRAEFARDACPKESIYGRIGLTTRLFDRPLAGPVYLRQSKSKLPSLVATLDGAVDLDLEVKLGFAGGRMRIAIDSVPDLPISKLALTTFGGRRGLFVNNRDLCEAPSFAAAELVAQNGKLSKREAKLGVPCGASTANVTGSDVSRRR